MVGSSHVEVKTSVDPVSHWSASYRNKMLGTYVRLGGKPQVLAD